MLMTSSFVAIVTPVFAQASDEAQNSNDIVVTAKARTERLQDVPLSITALSSDALQNNMIRDIKELQKVVPNLSLFSGSGRNDPSGWAMRGLTSNTSDERYQGISFFLDGIALSGQLASLDMDSVERVEVIKGPQSATFGRATYSGAVNFITKEPTSDEITGAFRARGSIYQGSNDPSYSFSGSLTAPIVKGSLWLTVAGSDLRNGAVADAIDTGRPIGLERTQTGTATLFWKPDDSFSVRLRGLYTHDHDSIAAQIVEQPRDWVVAGVPTTVLPRGAGSFLPTYLPDPDSGLVADHGRGGYTRDRYFGSAIVTKKFGDYTLTYSGGYFRSVDQRDAPSFPRSTVAGQDPVLGAAIASGALVPTSIANSGTTSSERFDNTSHQIVLLSPGDKPFRWRVGGYYFWEKDASYFQSFAVPATNPTGLASIQTFENFAAFGGIDWDFAPGFTLSGEGRIAREKLSYPTCVFCTSPNLADVSESATNFTPRVTLSYKITPDNMVYGLFSSGVKSGRFSNVTAAGQRPQGIIYARPEKLNNFEIGTKNSFLNNRVIVNLSGFYEKVKNQQLTSSTPYTYTNTLGVVVTNTITATNNVGKSDIVGFELESTFKVTRRFSLDGSLGYAHQKFTNSAPVVLAASSAVGFPVSADGSIIMKGKTQANVPWFNGYIAGQYVLPIKTDNLKFRADAAYRGKLYADLANTTAIKSSWTVNSQITYSHDSWDASVFARNIFNNQRSTGSGLAGGTATCGFTETNTTAYGRNQQCLFASPPRPLELGAEVSFKF